MGSVLTVTWVVVCSDLTEGGLVGTGGFGVGCWGVATDLGLLSNGEGMG